MTQEPIWLVDLTPFRVKTREFVAKMTLFRLIRDKYIQLVKCISKNQREAQSVFSVRLLSTNIRRYSEMVIFCEQAAFPSIYSILLLTFIVDCSSRFLFRKSKSLRIGIICKTDITRRAKVLPFFLSFFLGKLRRNAFGETPDLFGAAPPTPPTFRFNLFPLLWSNHQYS